MCLIQHNYSKRWESYTCAHYQKRHSKPQQRESLPSSSFPFQNTYYNVGVRRELPLKENKRKTRAHNLGRLVSSGLWQKAKGWQQYRLIGEKDAGQRRACKLTVFVHTLPEGRGMARNTQQWGSISSTIQQNKEYTPPNDIWAQVSKLQDERVYGMTVLRGSLQC